MPGDGSATCAGCGSDCPESAFFRTSPGRSPATSGGRTYHAEYVALTQLQADAFITLAQLAHAVKDLVTVAPIEALP
jgi:hypothetical protein